MDLQDSSSAIDLAIDKVGIVGVEKKVEIIQEENKKYSFYPKISALISLPAQQRGIHMSRSSETIEEVINDVVFKPASSIEIIADRIVKRLLEQHPYTTKVEVKLEGKIIIQVRESEQRAIQKAYKVSSFAKAKKNISGDITFNYFISGTALGMTCCPCALELSAEYAEEIIKNRKDIEIPEKTLEKLLNIWPLSSHNQRSKGTIILQINDLNNHKIDVLDIIDVIEGSMSGKIQSVLKRPEEARLVREAHLKPLFSEDVIREMAKNFMLKFADINLEDRFKVIFKIESYESIHPHNVYSEMITTIGELRAVTNREKLSSN